MISGDPPARNDDAVIQAIQKRLPNLFDDPISNCAAYEMLDRSAKGLDEASINNVVAKVFRYLDT